MNTLTMAMLVTAVLLIVTGLFMLVRTNNLIRIIIAVEIVMKAITLLLILAGYINGSELLPQAFIVTVIVIEVVVAVVAAGIAIRIYRHNGDLDIRKLNRLNG